MEQPFYRSGCNDGSGDELDLGIKLEQSAAQTTEVGDAALVGTRESPAASCPLLQRRRPPSGAERAAYAALLGEARLLDLIARIRRAHSQVRQSASWLL